MLFTLERVRVVHALNASDQATASGSATPQQG